MSCLRRAHVESRESRRLLFGKGVQTLVLLFMTGALGACQSPEQKVQQTGVESNPLISDQNHNNGTPGFFFLPPLVKAAAYGVFKPGLSPVVKIEELAPGTRGIIATFTTTSGTFGTAVKDDGVDHYQVNWDTKLYRLDPQLTYRIQVWLENFEMGFADVDVVESGSELKNVQTSEYIPLLDGRTLPIKFRIEPEALSCVGVYCVVFDQCHDAGVCDPFTGECSHPVKNDGIACSDGNACTQADTCQSGICIGVNPITCTSLDACHVAGTCDPATGACTNPELSCDDGDPCTSDGCASPADDFSGGCVHIQSTGPTCAQLCLYDPETNTTNCTPTSYDDVSIADSSLVGSGFHANQDVKVSLTLQSGAAHDSYPVQVVLLPAEAPDSGDPVSGTVIASTGIPIASAGTAEYWIDGHIPADLAPGVYVLVVHRYPDGPLIESAGPVAYDITEPDPGLPVLDLSDYFPDQQALLIDPASTVDPDDPTSYRNTPFAGTIVIVARNYPVTQVPLSAHLSWNGGDIPLLLWDPANQRYVDALAVGDPGHQLQPDVPRSVYVEVAISETYALTLRDQLADGPASAHVVFVVNANGSVLEAPCLPPVIGPPTCSHTISANALVALAPPPDTGAPSTFGSHFEGATSFASVFASAPRTPPLSFLGGYRRFVQNKYIGAGADFSAWNQLSEAGLDLNARFDFPVKMFDWTLHLLQVVINARAHRGEPAHVDYALVQAGKVIFASDAPLNIDASVINVALPFPTSFTKVLQQKSKFWIYIVPVNLRTQVDLAIGLDARVVARPGNLSLVANPFAIATGSVNVDPSLLGVTVGYEGTVALVDATLNLNQSGTFAIFDDPKLPGRQYLIGDLSERLHYEIDRLDGSIDLWARWPEVKVCKKWKIPYPCGFKMVKKTLPLGSWQGTHEGRNLIDASRSGYRINLPYAYPADFCSTPMNNMQRCGQLPPDDFGHAPDCGPCTAGYTCDTATNVCRSMCPAACITEFAIPGGYPMGIAVGSDGNLWFTEETGNQIGRITPGGAIAEFAIPTVLGSPWGIAAGPDGNLWFTESQGNRIGRITPGGAIAEFEIPTANSQPIGIAAGPDGNLWFTESQGSKIARITPMGEIDEFPTATAYAFPVGIAAGPDGNLWFTEGTANRIGRITPAGAITEFEIPTNSYPFWITAGPDGNLWFIESNVPQIGRITPAGTVAEFAMSAARGTPYMGIAAGPDGNLWFTQGSETIGRITPTGTVTEFATPTANSYPLGIVVGPDGNLWFTESHVNKIGRITP